MQRKGLYKIGRKDTYIDTSQAMPKQRPETPVYHSHPSSNAFSSVKLSETLKLNELSGLHPGIFPHSVVS